MRTIPWMCMMAATTLAAFAACSDSPDASPSNAPPTSDAGELPQTDASSVRDAAVVDASDAAAGGDTFSYCNGKNGPTLTFSPGQEQSVLDAINQLAECSTVRLGPGTFHFQNALTLRQKGVTLAGAGKGIKGALVGDATSTVLDFTTAAANTNGVDHVGDWVTVEGLALINAKKDALRIEASTNVRVRFVRAEWATENATDNGKYGIYPVKSTNVLIEDSEAYNAADAGIYVGQTTNAIIRRNTAKQNVAGIEIENTFDADVYENDAHDNTGGILVFDMPGLPQKGGHGVRVHANKIHGNNTANFAPKGNIVGKVPGGTGFFVMANHDVEVFDNVIEDNQTVAIGVISFFLAQQDAMDADYYPYPSRIHVHDNKLARNGTQVDLKSQVGLLLLTGKDAFPGGVTPDVVYDGIVDAAKGGGTNPMEICVKQGSFGNMHADLLDEANPDLSKVVTLDAAPYACTLPPLPAVQIPQAK